MFQTTNQKTMKLNQAGSVDEITTKNWAGIQGFRTHSNEKGQNQFASKGGGRKSGEKMMLTALPPLTMQVEQPPAAKRSWAGSCVHI